MTSETVAGIPFQAIDAKDPLVADWALERIKYLQERCLLAEADHLSRRIFDEQTIKHLLSLTHEDLLLSGMFRLLPDDLLVPHLDNLNELLPQLPLICFNPLVKLLLKHDPDHASRLFAVELPPGEAALELLFVLLKHAAELPESYRHEFAGQYLEQLFKNDTAPRFSPYVILPSMKLAWLVQHPRLTDLLQIAADGIFDAEGEETDRLLPELAEIITGTSKPLQIMIDRLNNYIAPKFTDIPLLLPDAALASELETVMLQLLEGNCTPASDFYLKNRERLPEPVVMALDLIHQRWSTHPEREEHEAPEAIFVLFPACIAASAWASAPVVEENQQAILSYLSTDLPDCPLAETLVWHIKGWERAETVELLLQTIETLKDGYGAVQITRLMGRLGYHEFVPKLIELLKEEFDALCIAAAQSLKQIGEPAISAVVMASEHDSEERCYYLTEVLEAIGGTEVSDYAWRNLDRLIKDDKEWAMSLLESVPEKRFIERIDPWVGKGQSLVDRTWLLLNKLNGTTSERMNELEQRYYREEQARAERRGLFERGDLAGSAASVLSIEMECQKCGDISKYKLHRIFWVGEGGDPPFVADILTCIACGQRDTLKLTRMGEFALTAELMRYMDIRDKKERDAAIKRSPFTMHSAVTVMGRKMGLQDGFDLYRETIAREPHNGEYHLGFGNFLRNIHRNNEARTHYETAIHCNPELIEAYWNLAELDDDESNIHSAFLWLQRGADQLPGIRFCLKDHAKRSEIVNAYVTMYNGIKKYLHIPGPLLQHSMFGLSGKVGRNDPCPCGSGKKYKKCCGA